MNCAEVQQSLVSYLEKEVTPGEQALVQQHLAECSVCERELAALAATRSSATQALHSLAAEATPSPQAWDRLQARLAEEVRSSPPDLAVWLRRLVRGAPGTPLSPSRYTVKRLLVPALAVVIVVAGVALLWLRAATPVSAQQILNRAQQARAEVQATSGIRHLRIESYTNDEFLPGVAATIIENYLDFQTRNMRLVDFDSATGQVVGVLARDETYIYNGWKDYTSGSGSLLTIYRSPRPKGVWADQMGTGLVLDDEALWFEAMRRDPNVEAGRETWPDGRQVYVLRSQQPVEVYPGSGQQLLNGWSILVLDAQTYQAVEYRITIPWDGQEVLVSSSRYLADEVLPAGSYVAWDLSDLQGVQIEDGPHPAGYGGLQFDVISRQELASRTQSAYALRSIPDTFSEEISVMPEQLTGEQPVYYIVAYTSAAGDYLVLEAWDGPRHLVELMDETYTTATGLELSFIPAGMSDLAGNPLTQAIVQAPDGALFILKSNLPREQVQALAEDLVPVR